ncbi:hypothetical protein [Paraburkholderia sp. 35.1]|uniref:hypothetical protein n=1 Tax=Paraburkholderia sp. 35.1 TaxID=2991058 RepID=UPI003D1D27A4
MANTTKTAAPVATQPLTPELTARLNAGVRDVSAVALSYMEFADSLFAAISMVSLENCAVAKGLADIGSYLTEHAMASVEAESDHLGEIVKNAAEAAHG